MRYIDLHTHTLASDGALSPTELVHLCAQKQVGVLSVTDHDTVSGIEEAMLAGEKYGVKVIPGVELSATHERELHILGLFVDIEHPEFAEVMQQLRVYREERNLKMIEALNAQGLKITAEDVLKYKPGFGMDTIGRVHMARALVEKAYCGDIATAFEMYVSGDSPAYVRRQLLDAKACIDLIHKAGGYAFLAHGFHSESEPEKLYALLDELRSYGLDGVECYHSDHSVHQTELLLRYCEQYALLVSGGSDFHGENKPHVQLAKMPYGLKLPTLLITRLNQQIEDKIKQNLV